MRIIYSVLLAAVALMLAAAPQASAQQRATPIRITAPWQLLLFDTDDPDMASAINDLKNVGYTPVGVEVATGIGLEVLMVKDGREAGRWAIQEHTDLNLLQAEITASIRDGFVPMDISRTQNGFVILWLETDTPAVTPTGWIIASSPNTPEKIDQTLNRYQPQGYTLNGISLHQDLLWYLFVNSQPAQQAQILQYDKSDGAIEAGMLAEADHGWLPYGIASDASTMFIGYVK